MKTGDFRESLTSALSYRYGREEALAIANTFIGHHLNVLPSQVSMHANSELTHELVEVMRPGMNELQNGKPVQYVLNTGWFLNRSYYVNESVLIPRPETEELVMMVTEYLKKRSRENLQLLDLGTGSGCIPISIQKMYPEISATGTDVSEAALKVAVYNAERLQAQVHFMLHDMSASTFDDGRSFDVIVSNPPYIPPSEKSEMEDHVTNFEPHIALFTPETDPLFFYRCIASIAKKHLNEGGALFLEIHYDSGDRVRELLVKTGLHQVEIRKDLNGNNRFVTATR